jgi:hypothetical protein
VDCVYYIILKPKLKWVFFLEHISYIYTTNDIKPVAYNAKVDSGLGSQKLCTSTDITRKKSPFAGQFSVKQIETYKLRSVFKAGLNKGKAELDKGKRVGW